MIHFSDAPPADPRGFGLPLVRTPQSKPIIGALTCEKLLYCPTHFWGGRTVPHDQTECEACNHGSPFRWHAYVTAIDHRTHLHFLFETTSKAADPLMDWQTKHGTLRGAKFQAMRPQQRHNGRVVIQLKSIDLIEFPLPEPPNIAAALAVIWNIPLDDIADGLNTLDRDMAVVDRGTAETAAAVAAKLDATRKTEPTALPAEAAIERQRSAIVARTKARRAAHQTAINRTVDAAERGDAKPLREEFQRLVAAGTKADGNGRPRAEKEITGT